MRIGLFFGSFDPIHIGHYATIIKALDRTNMQCVDKVILIPAKHNPWKSQDPAPFGLRVTMCATVGHCISRELGNGKVVVSDIEGTFKDEKVFTYMVLEELQKKFPKDQLVIICGTDIANEIKGWKRGDWILENFHLLCVDRGGMTDSSDPAITVSSTDIRKMISNKQCPLPYIMSVTYFQIKKHKLYNCKLKY